MVRTSGGGAVGAVPASGGKGGKKPTVPEVPLKRLHPWSRDNSFLTDIVAGAVDKQGQFRGIVMKDANLMSVMRYLQLAKTLVPETMPADIRGLVQAVNEGYPTIVVTRGAYGRQLDAKKGPLRNGGQERVWEAVRAARKEMPRMNITCVDAPAHATTAEIARCAEPPLDQYRELAYYDGVWYAPESVSAENFLKWSHSNPRKPLVSAGVRNGLDTKENPNQLYRDRKAFGWNQPDYSCYYAVSWKPVHTEEEFVHPKVDPERLAFDASQKSEKAAASADVIDAAQESNLVNAMLIQDALSREWERLAEERPQLSGAAKAGLLLQLVDAVMQEQVARGRVGAKAAASRALSHLRKLFQQAADESGELEALRELARVCLSQAELGEGKALVAELRQLCSKRGDSKGEANAERLLVEALIHKDKVEEAVEAARALGQHFAGRGDAAGSASAAGVLVDVHLAKRPEADCAAALAVASEARTALQRAPGGGQPEAQAVALMAMARVHKAMAQSDKAAQALGEACTLLRQGGSPALEADAREQLAELLLEVQDYTEGHRVVDEMLHLGKQDPAINARALRTFAKLNHASGAAAEFVQGPGAQAVAAFEQLGDYRGAASAKLVVAQSLLAGGQAQEASQAAKEAEVLLKRDHVAGAPLAEVFLCAARASLALENTHSALWSAKQALVAAATGKDADLERAAHQIIAKVEHGGGKVVTIGRATSELARATAVRVA